MITLFALSYWLLGALLDHDLLAKLGEEDQAIENVGAAGYLAATLLLLIAFSRRRRAYGVRVKTERRQAIFFLLLGLFFFVCFGEEISWGQRIFHIDTPEPIKKHSASGEINIHNLWIFYHRYPDGYSKSFWKLLMNMNRLLSIMWLGFCVMLPLAERVSSGISDCCRRIGLPVPPLWIGGLFLATYISFCVTRAVFSNEAVVSSFDELKETQYALSFAVLGLYYAFASHPSQNLPSDV